MLALGSACARGITPVLQLSSARRGPRLPAPRPQPYATTQAATLERLLAYQLLLPAGPAAPAGPTAWQRGLRAAKIGATGVGVGALFAVTGGLAAPAIAAGVGAAITLVGGAGAAAAAAGAAGFLATAAGTAATAAGVGVAGGSFAGSRMARRMGDVREFGFVELAAAEGASADSEPGSGAGGAAPAAPAAGPGGPAVSAAVPVAAAAAGGRGRAAERVTNSGEEEEEPAFSPRGDAERDPFLLSRPPDQAPGRDSPPGPAEPWDDAAPPARALELRELGGARGGAMGRAAALDPYAEHVDEGHLALPARALLGSARPGPGRGPGGAEEPGRRELPGRAPPADEHASAPAAGPADERAGGWPGGAPPQAAASAGAPAGAPAGPGRRSHGGAGPPGEGARGGDASGSPTRGAGAGPGGWAWPRRKDLPLLLAPISATVRADDMRMALTIGAPALRAGHAACAASDPRGSLVVSTREVGI